MADYVYVDVCPNCEKRNKGFAVFKCKDCGFKGCYKDGFFSSSGCWKQIRCPSCEGKNTTKWGYIRK